MNRRQLSASVVFGVAGLAKHDATSGQNTDVTTLEAGWYRVIGQGATTDMRAPLLAAIAAADASAVGGGTVEVIGICAFTGVLDVPHGVNIVGMGSGKHGGQGTRFIALDAAAQFSFGDQVTAGYGGTSGNFRFDGNGLATNPILVGVIAGRVFDPIYITNTAAGGAAMTLAGSQNLTIIGLRIEDCAGDGLVFDRGAGGNNFFSLGIADCAGWAIKFVQTGLSPLVYPSPHDNHIFGYMIEAYSDNHLGLVYHGAGSKNQFHGGTLASSHPTTSRALLMMRVDSTNVSQLLTFSDGTWYGNSMFVTGMDLGTGTSVVLHGHQTSINLLCLINAEDESQVHNQAHVNLGGTATFFVSPTATAGAEDTIVADRHASAIQVTRSSESSIAFQASSGPTHFCITAAGVQNWNNRVALYEHGTAGAVGVSGQVVTSGGVTIKTTPGVPGDTDVPSPVDGTMVLDTTNHRLYVRSGGVWRYAALTEGSDA